MLGPLVRTHLTGWDPSSLEQIQDRPTRHTQLRSCPGEREPAGCDDYDTKPVELPRLLAKIEALTAAPGSWTALAAKMAPVDLLSYYLCYRFVMAQREKRSISLPPDLAARIDRAAAEEGTSVSAWIAATAAHRLRLEGGRRGIAAWERQRGALTAEELAEGLARARAILGRPASKRKAS